MSGVRRGLQPFASRVLRSRYGVAALLALIVLAVVGGARWFGHPAEPSGAFDEAPGAPGITVGPTGPDDGVISPAPFPSPRTSPGTAEPMAVARAFAAAWLRHRGVTSEQWYAGLLPHASRVLAAKLSGVDPAGVPADRIAGEPVLVPRGESLVEVMVPVDTGRLSLRLVAVEGRWLVDGVDWERS